MKTIPLTQGKVTIVDDDAPSWIFEVKWYAQSYQKGTFRAARNVRLPNGIWTHQYMHAVIAGTPPGFDTLHIDGNSLNNQSSNVKPGSRAQNQHGPRKKHPKNISGFRGVVWDKRRQIWEANLTSERRKHFIGYFRVTEEAARARDEHARSLGWPEEGMNFPRVARDPQ